MEEYDLTWKQELIRIAKSPRAKTVEAVIRKISVALGVAEGMLCLHEHGMLHRE
jgi:hypothetical protein